MVTSVAATLVRRLHRDLVRIPSVSGSEAGVADRLALYLEESGHRPRRMGRNLICARGRGRPALLLNSHMDTVPASESWTVAPHAGRVVKGRLVGLGAADAKASLAAMAVAFVLAPEPAGRLVLAATCDEETGGEGLEAIAHRLGPLDGAVVGEPTRMAVCIAQRGLLKIAVLSSGRRAHAARPHQGENAIYKALDDVAVLRAIRFSRRHSLLGLPTIAVTMIQGGIRSNVVPDACEFVADIRTTPEYDNDAILAQLRRRIASTIEVRSNRIRPVSTDPSSRIVRCCLGAAGVTRPTGFGGISDMVWLSPTPTVVMGPGSPEASHQAGEWIDLADLDAAVDIDVAVIRDFLGESGKSWPSPPTRVR